ncbi:unnamed protein product [Rhizopus stolonifer]
MDVNLERTGTRPRRQVKSYSIDTTYSETKSKQVNQPRILLLLVCSISILFLFFNYHHPIRNDHHLEFNDTSQYTDYALLEQLLIQDNVPSPLQSTLASKGHSLDTLLTLPLETIPSITVVLKTHWALPLQIQAVLAQTKVPDVILIMGDEQQAQALQDGKRVRYSTDPFSNLKTEYVWLLEPDVLPGSRSLEYVLKATSTTDEVVGTEGQQNGCVWTEEESQPIESLRDNVLLRTEWIPYRENLYQHGIRSVLLPSDAADQSHWGNTQRKDCAVATASKLVLPENPVLVHATTQAMRTLACEFKTKGRPLVVVSQKDLKCDVDVFKSLERVVNFVQPAVIISDKPMKKSGVPVIHLDEKAISSASWMTKVPASLLAEWNSISIKIMVSVTKKNDNLKRLLSSLDSAHFMGDNVDLTLLMDYTTDHAIHQTVNHYAWSHGPKYLRHRIASAHRMAQFAESWYPTSNNEYAILLDTELELSPHFYIWAKYAALRYRRSSQRLFGISLYRPELIETDPEGRRLFTERPSSTFLMQWPAYSGALFFPEHWREFHDYLTTRLADREGFGMQEVNVPKSRSNEWKLSWRRYFEELVYLRSYVMLYPPVSLSTRHVELKKKSQREKYADALVLYDVPLMTEMKVLPAWKDLAVIDFYGQPASFEVMKERGAELQDSISSCLPNQEIDFDPSDLLCPFARIVTIEVENENDPVVELAPKQADVFV